ncbi:zinc ribbon domain-containing protein [Alloyangia pacifica]|uniref:Recombinase zinc beta ribbon domain-containing protein n=1 Tax=Alloyangia pacifica TaxID=311180 RepID=A0A1I6WN65_9RHOB|nr:zinc ribbon domain-containing protein [Alloyangia pacifica]SDI97061.1 Recombinase zinc beta ribbon domain-containing protein [Alloyangia pacifica]SFT27453.1 Recombinase zinc beta ribbon domain-containing protein [Alloyangia pacifica]
MKDPATGKRVSRLDPECDWVIQEVPELRIISDALWTSVKARQSTIDATPAVKGIRKSKFREKRRGPHLHTGKLACACCGGTFAAVGRDYIACSNARKLGTCDARKSIKRAVLEEAVLDLLRDRLMQPDAVAEFVSAFTRTANAERASETASRQQAAKALKELERKLQGFYDAIADEFRTPGLLQQLEGLEARKAALETDLQAPSPAPVRFHPGLAELYRKKVAELSGALRDEAIRTPALDVLRGLIKRVVVRHEGAKGGLVLELKGRSRR